MTATPSSTIHKISDIQSVNKNTKSVQSLQLLEHCPDLQLDQSKQSPKTQFTQRLKGASIDQQYDNEQQYQTENETYQFFKKGITTLHSLKYDSNEENQIFDNRRDYNKKFRPSQSFSTRNLDYTITSSMATDDFGFDAKFRDFYITERNTVISTLQKSIIKKLILSNQFPAESFRKDIWLIASGANKLIKNNSGYYQKLLNNYPDFVFFKVLYLNEKFFRDKQNVKSLKRVLVAYARRNPQIGYCQGFNFIAARLLKLFSEQQAFWIYTSILQTYTPPNYYSDMTGLCIDAQIFSILLKQRFKALYDKMNQLDVQITSASWQWFACIFSYNLQQQDLLRIWDLYFLQGPTMLFRLSLCIIAVLQKDLLALKDAGQIQMILSRLPVTAMKRKNQFFRNLEKNPKCNYFSKERLQRMRQVIERKKFKLQEGELKDKSMNHGLIFKSSTHRQLIKPRMTDFESVTSCWSTIAIDEQDMINDDDNDSQNSQSTLSLSYASPSSLSPVVVGNYSQQAITTFSPQSPQLSSCKFLQKKIQQTKKPGCFPPWPVCTHFLSNPMELTQIAYRVSSQSFHINQNYFYQSENDLSRRCSSSISSRSSCTRRATKERNPVIHRQQKQDSINQIKCLQTQSSIQQKCQPKNSIKSSKQQRKKRVVHIMLKQVDLPKEEDFTGREYQNLLIMRQSHQCSSCC